MSTRKNSKGLNVNAIAGPHLIVLGFYLLDEKRKKCLAFAMHREPVTEGEKYRMSGMTIPTPGSRVCRLRAGVRCFANPTMHTSNLQTNSK